MHYFYTHTDFNVIDYCNFITRSFMMFHKYRNHRNFVNTRLNIDFRTSSSGCILANSSRQVAYLEVTLKKKEKATRY